MTTDRVRKALVLRERSPAQGESVTHSDVRAKDGVALVNLGPQTLMVYRLLMLAWALWLAYALLRWARWGWECFSDHGLWRRLDLWKRIARRRAGRAEPTATQ